MLSRDIEPFARISPACATTLPPAACSPVARHPPTILCASGQLEPSPILRRGTSRAFARRSSQRSTTSKPSCLSIRP
eukprot:6164159-Pleurochrysis_carterae.AAC.1